MTKFAAFASALAIAALLGGTAAYTYLVPLPECGGNSAVSGSGRVGGPFELMDTRGRTVSDADVINGPTLLYFGYSFCPDICPFDVARNALAVDLLAEQGLEVTPLFITIDPERDTADVLAEYAEVMHPDMVALTGTDDQIRAAADAYRVFYRKGAGEGDSYLFDHTTFTYLVFPDRGVTTYFSRTIPAEDMAAEVACHLGLV